MRRSMPIVFAASALLALTPGANATFPGDSGLIVFQDETDEGIQVFTMSPDGSGVRRITQLEPVDGVVPEASQPDWSPDGSRIAFAYMGCQVGLIDADGGNLVVLSDESETGRHGDDLCEADPSFTPDGQSIVFERYDATTDRAEVWRMGLDGAGRTSVTDACSIDPNVSPDGTRLTCKGIGLSVVNMDGSGAAPIGPEQDVAYKHDWAPDGSAIVFSDNSDDSSPDAINIATVAPDGTSVQLLTDVEAGSHAYVGGYSPDGGSIIYRVDRGEEAALFVMAADGSDVRQVTDFGSFRPRYLDWGPAQAQ